LNTVEFDGKAYEVDEYDFLVRPGDWDINFAEGMAPSTGILGGLTPQHWDVLWYMREVFLATGKCPVVYKACKAQNLRLSDLERLFPSGYRRGVCKLAGLCQDPENIPRSAPKSGVSATTTVYRTNAAGYLVDSAEWNEEFAVHKWEETKMPTPLTEKHWQLIYYLRGRFEKTGKIPTIYEICEENNIDIENFGELFPDGYHRGAVKVAGLPNLF